MSVDSLEKRDLILQVHGTFASRKEDQGDSWWQVGSSVFERMRQRLPVNVALAEPDEVFHWSGENSERARIKAATHLYERLKDLERQGRYYHLIGHSHGGSVIWHTLRLAAINQRELKCLRSWTTVGTPFLRHALPSVSRWSNILRIAIGLILIKPAYLTAVKIFDLLFRPNSSVWLGHGTTLPDKFTLYDTPVLRLLELMNVPIERVAGHIRIGSLHSESGQLNPSDMLTSPVGWLMILMALIVITVYLNLAAFTLRPVIESWQLWAETRLEQRAKNDYAARWLGIWSPDDEAINGLRATLDLTVSFIARMRPNDRILFSDYATVTMQPYYWVLTPLFNSLLQPSLDKLIRSIVVKSAQGNNRPGTEVVEVGPIPWKADETHASAPLPDWLNEHLVQSANNAAKDSVPRLRSLLAAPSFSIGLESWGKGSSLPELIHTSYFDHDEIIDLLTMHIAGSCELPHWATHSASRQNIQLATWLAESKLRGGCAWFESHLPSSVRTRVNSIDSPFSRIRPRRITASKAA